MRIKVEFEVDLPVDADDQQIQEWLSFGLGERGEMKLSNPLSDHDIEAVSFTVDWGVA